jgi:RNA polymerase sigma factor (TIGR02999 family)
MPESNEITVMLRKWSEGSQEALNDLLPLVYDELHKRARQYLRRERSDHTLQPTALIHEAYLKLAGQNNMTWQDRSHFFAISANVMRRILVDHARAKHRDKRGGDDIKIPLEEAALVINKEKDVNLIALDEALNRLAALDEQQSRIVELRYFSGLSLEETAEALSISRSTAARDWAMAKAWLHRELTK